MKPRKALTVGQWLLIVGATVAVSGIAAGAFWYSRPVVTVSRVLEGPVVQSFYATGTVEPVTEYPIKTSNAGIVTHVFFDKGDRVKKDQVLAVVEDPQLLFLLEKAKAELELARQRADDAESPVLKEYDARLQANAAMLNNAREELRRLNEVGAKGASRTDVERAADHVQEVWSSGESLRAQRAASRLQLQSDLHVAEASLAAAQRNFDLQSIRCPIDGVVLDRPSPVGTRLAVNLNDHVMQIADVRPENLVMRAAVDEENKASLRDGQTVRMALYSFPGRTFEGRVAKVYDKADTDRRTFEVDVKLEPPEMNLAAGMTGEMAFIIDTRERVLVAPAQALQGDNFYTVENGRLRRVADAAVGAKSVERIELAHGFHLDQVIVISPVAGLKDGEPVRTTAMDPHVAAGLNKPKNNAVFKGGF